MTRAVALDAEDVRNIRLALLHVVDICGNDRPLLARLWRAYRRVCRLGGQRGTVFMKEG